MEVWQLPGPPPPVTLPIDAQRGEIDSALRKSRVVIIVGGTGCGKSSRVPQYLMQQCERDGIEPNILVTQPRRMAAVTLARRVAEETGTVVGKEVGYRIRGEVFPGSQLSFVTAGYLLSWFTMDPTQFASLTHIVLDEAHIRTADMELLLLFVRTLMRLHPGPRLVLMSATITASTFTKYFAEACGEPLPPVVGMIPRPPEEEAGAEAAAPEAANGAEGALPVAAEEA